MSVNVRRGLGLLAVAALGLLVGLVVLRVDDGVDGPLAVAVLLVGIAAGLAFWGGLIGGLALLAWGLLRAPR